MDGSERIELITEKLGWPNGVTLDIDNFRIYWCDAKLDKIEYAKMDGSDRRELTNTDVPHVFGLTLMGDFLYWTDWQRRVIDRVHKETGEYFEINLNHFLFSCILCSPFLDICPSTFHVLRPIAVLTSDCLRIISPSSSLPFTHSWSPES